MLFIRRGKHSSRGVRGYAGKGQARAAGPALLAIAAAALCLAGPTVASAAQQPGTALAWGYNGYGELGDGSRTQISYTPVAVDLPAGTQVAAVAAGDFHSLAVTSDGGVLAWGANNDGQLGDGSSTTFSTTPVAVDLPAATRVTAVAAGFNQSLALTSDGSVLAWGLNNDGQLGDGSTTDSSTPVAVDLPAGTRVTAIAAGGYDSLALTSNGSVLAWGDGQDGALGADDGGALESSTPVAVDLPAGTRVTAIAAGDGYSLALTSDGSVLAWGSTGTGTWGTAAAPPCGLHPRRSRWTCPRAPASPPSPPAAPGWR